MPGALKTKGITLITQDTTPKKKKPTIKKINSDHVVVVRKRPKPKITPPKKAAQPKVMPPKPVVPQKHAAPNKTLRDEIIAILPKKMPWKIGISKEIHALIKKRHPEMSNREITIALDSVIIPRVYGYRYLKHMSCGGVRHGLDGEKMELSENHRKDAVRKVRTMINRQKKYYQIKRMLDKKRKNRQQ